MGKIRNSLPVKLTIAFIFAEEKYLKEALRILIKHFAPIDFTSPTIPFDYTEYYRKEFGTKLKRVFVSFSKLIDPANTAKIKHLCNRIEKKLSVGARRRINIDPGYLDLSKLVIATTKDYSHRIYLRRGIYAEITLSYQKDSFCSLPGTYPDYRSSEYIAIFNKIREIYHKQLT